MRRDECDLHGSAGEWRNDTDLPVVSERNAGGRSYGATFTSTTLANNDQVSVVITSNAGCLTTPTATATVGITVTTGVTPAVSINASQTTICAGTSVTFTAVPVNGGTTPTYQWSVNGTPVAGATGATFTSTTLANNDQVSVVMTSNAGCLTTPTATA